LWFGTQSGLFRYDGFSVENMSTRSDSPNQFTFALYVDSKGILWVGTEHGAAYYSYENDTFHKIEFPTDSERYYPKVYDFVEYDDGLLAAASDGLYRLTENEAFPFGDLTNKTVRTLVVSNRNELFVGTEREGLFKKFDDGFRSYVIGSEELALGRYVRELLFDNEDFLWVASHDAGVHRIAPNRKEVAKIDPSLGRNSHARALLQDQNGRIWIGSDEGLHLWSDAGVVRHINPSKSRLIYDLFEDSAGTIWFSTLSGVARLNPQFTNLHRIDLSSLDSSGPITSFAESSSGDVAVGTTKGVAIWKPEAGVISDAISPQTGFEGFVTAVEFDEGNLWIGTYAKGLFRWDGIELHGPFDTQFGLLRRHGITDLHLSQSGQIWIATAGVGVFYYNPKLGLFEQYPTASNENGRFPDLQCIAIREDSEGLFWIGTNNSGPFRFDPLSGSTHVQPDPSLFRKSSYVALNDFGVWFGSYTGEVHLLRSVDGSVEAIEIDSGPLLAVYGIQGFSDLVFIAGSNQMVVYNYATGKQVFLDARHNLVPEISQGASIALSSGYVLFGGSEGFNVVSRKNFESEYSHKPSVRVTSVEINHESIDYPDWSLSSLSHIENDLSFSYSITDFLFPQQLNSRYKLEGFDRNWIDNGASRNITYTNLDPGSYILRVKATNSEGVWSPNELALPINIFPPWWATWWAYTLYAFSALFLFYQLLQLSARRVSVRAEERFNQRLKHYVSALDDASECVFNASESGRILYVNDAIHEVLGKPVSEAIGHSLFEVLFDLEEQKIRALDTLHRDGRFLGEIEQEGKVLEVSIRKGEASVEDNVAFVCVVRDVTTRSEQSRHLEAEIEKLTAELGRVSDDLKESVAKSAEFQVEAEKRLRQDETLLKSFHDRINDNFQMLSSLFSIQAARSSDGVIADLLDENQQRLKAVGLVHEQLLQTKQLSHVAMAEYVDVLATSLYRKFAPANIQLELIKELSPVNLSIEQAVPAGLILNELLSNALIHAFKDKSHGTGKLKVSFYELAGDCVILISDDGQGLSQNFQAEPNSGVGFEIVTILTQQLDGSFKRVGGIGTTFEVRFPIVSST